MNKISALAQYSWRKKYKQCSLPSGIDVSHQHCSVFRWCKSHSHTSPRSVYAISWAP